jgi:integrase
MPRPNKIWFRKDVGWWMVTLAGKKIRLAEGRPNKKIAERKFHELAAIRPLVTQPVAITVADIIERFLATNSKRLPSGEIENSETMRSYKWYGQAFAEYIGDLLVTELQPIHVTEFVKSKERWGQTTQYNARRSIFRFFSWATEEGILPKNPLQKMKRLKPDPRNRAMTHDEFRKLMRGEPKTCFKTFLYALWATGCRPKEARTLKWELVKEDRWVLPKHKTSSKTKKPRVIYLTASMQKLMSVLRRNSSSEYVFLNCYGEPWTQNSVRLRIARLRKRLNLAGDVCAYLIRHAFGTNALLNGVDVVTLAELMGHTSLEMVTGVYVHLAGKHNHLQGAAELATQKQRPAGDATQRQVALHQAP